MHVLSNCQKVSLRVAMILTFLLPAKGFAGKSFLDTFEDGSITDGSPVSWVRDIPPFDHGDFSLSNGDLLITPGGGPPPFPGLPNYWEVGLAVADELYNEMTMRMLVHTSDTLFSVAGLGIDTFFNSYDDGLGIYGGVLTDTRELILHWFDNDVSTELSRTVLSFSQQNSDLHLQLTVSSDRLTLSAWPDGSPDRIREITSPLPAELRGLTGRVQIFAGNSTSGATTIFREVEVTVPGIPGDFDGDSLLTANDIDLLSGELRGGGTDLKYDVNGDGVLDALDHGAWVRHLAHTWYGDADLDGEFNSADLVTVLTAGQYEDSIVGNSTWAKGDWNGDGEFDSGDLIAAFSDGGYEQGPRAAVAAVPEPCAIQLLVAGGMWLMIGMSRRC